MFLSNETQEEPEVQHGERGEQDTNIILLSQYLKTNSIKNASDKLNVCVGTIKRWIELKDVPKQYTFDIYKLLLKKIDYSKYEPLCKDQFFTPNNVANMCLSHALSIINIAGFSFIEPSAGDGVFMKILPIGTIGLDIEPRAEGIQKADYLLWTPFDKTKRYIVFGNPPFGLRGHLALQFINHSYDFADYVCFILPQLFNSNGKGSPHKRVKYNLIHSENLSSISFRLPPQPTPLASLSSLEGKEVKINCVFQIWSKYLSNPEYELKENKEMKDLKIYSLSDGGSVSTIRNKAMIGHCDIYLPSTCFGKDKMRLYTSFEELPNKKGYGIVFLNNKSDMIEKASRINWADVSFQSTNSAYNLRTSIILENLEK